MKQYLLILSVSLFLVSSCKKDNQTEPETVTVNGKTFGCKVDGKTFIPDYWDYGNNIPPISIDFSNVTFGGFTLIVEARRENEIIEIFLNKPLFKGVHELKFITRAFPTYAFPKDYGLYQVKNISPQGEYITNDTVGGYVDLIEIDTLTNKVYGKFEFTGTDKLTNKQVKVTNGIFKNY